MFLTLNDYLKNLATVLKVHVNEPTSIRLYSLRTYVELIPDPEAWSTASQTSSTEPLRALDVYIFYTVSSNK